MIGGMNTVLDVASNGTLVYVPGSATSRLPVWVDRKGGEEAIKAPSDHQFMVPRLSPDGRRLAFHDRAGGEYDVWVLDLERGTVERLTPIPAVTANRSGHPTAPASPIYPPDSLVGLASSSVAPTGPAT